MYGQCKCHMNRPECPPSKRGKCIFVKQMCSDFSVLESRCAVAVEVACGWQFSFQISSFAEHLLLAEWLVCHIAGSNSKFTSAVEFC